MNNQIFQPTRFIFYLKRTLFERRNSLLNVAAVYILLSLVISLLIPYLKGVYLPGATDNLGMPYSYDPMWVKELKFFIFLWISAGIMCSDIFSPLQKKIDRTVIFTCPASSFEKFLSLFLIYAVAIPFVLVICYFFADAVRVWVYSGIYPDCHNIHYISPDYLLSFGCSTNYLDEVSGTGANAEAIRSMLRHSAMMKYSLILLGGLLIQALYSLGSSVWPKKSAFKTSVFLLAMGLACGNLFYYGMKAFHGHGSLVPRSFGIANTDLKIAVINICVIAFIIFTWWVAYRRFKEWEVIKRW